MLDCKGKKLKVGDKVVFIKNNTEPELGTISKLFDSDYDVCSIKYRKSNSEEITTTIYSRRLVLKIGEENE